MAAGGRNGPAFWIGATVGAALVAFGLRGLLENEPRGASSALRWMAGSAIAIDLVVIPLVGAVALAVRRWAPAWTWPVLRAALVVTGVLVVFAAPLVTDRGGTTGNPTVRPRDYGVGLAVALGWTWAVAAVSLVVMWRRRGRSSRAEPSGQRRSTTAAPTSSGT